MSLWLLDKWLVLTYLALSKGLDKKGPLASNTKAKPAYSKR